MTLGVSIEIEKTGEKIHSIDDLGLAVSNNDYIGEPEQETSYVTVPGASVDLDLSEALTGAPIFKSRPLKLEFGGIRERMMWDTVISELRNKIHGQIVRLIFDNDVTFYWRGRAYIKDFDRTRTLGTFLLSIPHADPFKYDVFSSNDNWEWDPFDFEDGVIRYIPDTYVEGQKSFTFPKGNKLVTPIIEISNIEENTEVFWNFVKEDEDNPKLYPLSEGENRPAQLKIAGDEEVQIEIRGMCMVRISYRGGSL